jgi:hypothetical protein
MLRSMARIKVNFGYFWPGFDPSDNFYTRVLSRKYTVEISDDPDLFIFTHPHNGKRNYLKYSCHRLFIGHENDRTDWNCADYVLDSDFYPDNHRHKRWPIWAAWNTQALTVPKDPALFRNKKKFSCMVVSNANAKERIAFFHELSKYKHVDSGGRFLNNVNGPVADKRSFIKDYKFVLSFENSTYPGYTTEKLIEPMLVNSIPIYWGNERVGEDFNTQSFVHVNSFASYEAVIDRIIELDRDEEQYMQMAMQPWFYNNEVPAEMTQESLEAFFDFVLEDMKTKPPVAASFLKTNLHKLQLAKQKLEDKVYGRLGINRGFR